MSIYDFSEDKYIKTFDADEEIRMGGFSLASGSSGPIGHIRVFMYIQDFTALGGSEAMVMKIYTSTNYSNTYITSDAALLSGITFDTSNPSNVGFLGYLRFDFNDEYLNSNFTYYPTVTISNYTPNGDSFYIGLAYDYPDPVYDNGGTFFYNQSIAMQIFTKQQRSV
jgi:hypothetical protein